MAFTPFVETDQPTMANFNEKFLEIVAGATKIEAGSYEGTGTFGEDNPVTINCSFHPVLVFVYLRHRLGVTFGETGNTPKSGSCLMWMEGVLQADRGWQSGAAATTLSDTFTFDSDNNQLSFYTTGSFSSSSYSTTAEMQLNKSGTTYGYIVVGV